MEMSGLVQDIMEKFARRTCIGETGCTPTRYLWTDAFAVCNYLGLFHQTGDEKYKKKALILVEEVHHILGKHRNDDTSRSGWISGLSPQEGEMHPAIGGLRIGKKRDERKLNEPFNERLEWEQDGQYFHYLTKWMHALNLVSRETGDFKYNRWAMELAKTAFEKFSYRTLTHERRMYWKMSIDLSYPLVSAMGQHDAMDGYIICLMLQQTAFDDSELPHELNLASEMVQLVQMTQTSSLTTDDPLGLGELLSDACLLMKTIYKNDTDHHASHILEKMLSEAKTGIEKFLQTNNTLNYPAAYRLAFRELGLSIGFHGVEQMETLLKNHPEHFSPNIHRLLNELLDYLPVAKIIEKFWMEPANQMATTWNEHLDINSVMLATSLQPEGYFDKIFL